MNIANIFSESQQINEPYYIIIIIFLISVGLIIFLTGIVIYLIKKIKYISKPRFGFGGKTITVALYLFLSVSLIPVVGALSYQTINTYLEAQKGDDLYVDIQTIQKNDDYYFLTFNIIPITEMRSFFYDYYEVKICVNDNCKNVVWEKDLSKQNNIYYIYETEKGEKIITIHVSNDYFNQSEEFKLDL